VEEVEEIEDTVRRLEQKVNIFREIKESGGGEVWRPAM
jgi:hypothetical protein